MDTQCIPQTTEVERPKRSKADTGDFFSMRSGRSTAPAAVVGKPKWWVVSGRARLRIVTTLTRWFDFFLNFIPRVVARTIQFDIILFGLEMIQFDEHTFQVG